MSSLAYHCAYLAYLNLQVYPYVFGGVVDAYTMTEAVKDGITVNLVYDGRAAKVMLKMCIRDRIIW